eukprot:7377829-Prymnesium_polylepis.2
MVPMDRIPESAFGGYSVELAEAKLSVGHSGSNPRPCCTWLRCAYPLSLWFNPQWQEEYILCAGLCCLCTMYIPESCEHPPSARLDRAAHANRWP